MSIGPAEIIIVLILALLVFGPKRLPQMGRSLGKGVREFRKAADTAKQEFGLNEVTDGIKDVKSSISEPFKEVKDTVTEPFKDVKDTVGDLKQAVDVKSAIEAPVETAAAAGAAGAAAAAAPASEAPEVVDVTPMVTPRAADGGVTAREPSGAAEAPATEPPQAPEAPDAPEAPESASVDAPAATPTGA